MKGWQGFIAPSVFQDVPVASVISACTKKGNFAFWHRWAGAGVRLTQTEECHYTVQPPNLPCLGHVRGFTRNQGQLQQLHPKVSEFITPAMGHGPTPKEQAVRAPPLKIGSDSCRSCTMLGPKGQEGGMGHKA